MAGDDRAPLCVDRDVAPGVTEEPGAAAEVGGVLEPAAVGRQLGHEGVAVEPPQRQSPCRASWVGKLGDIVYPVT